MSRQERARLVELLDAAEREYQDRTSELSDEQWVYKVTPVTWSVGEIAEHIMLAESLLFGCAEMA
ncbi:MAG TPA: DinB family protein, partial [Blastocatellia bacterium]|nr:DinB family protein [Blastocatellia bacterium]